MPLAAAIATPASSRGKQPGIQWMRALAALLVVVDHCFFTLADKAGGDTGVLPLAAFLGGSGVQVFFVISGLVMVMAGTRAFGPAASLEFLRRRVIRVIPLYWIVTLLYGLKLWAEGRPPSAGALLASLLFVPHLNEAGLIQPVYGLGWSLNDELMFYLLFALGLLGSLWTTLGLTTMVLALLVAFGAGLAPPAAGDGPGVALFFWSRPIVLFFVAGMSLPLLAARLAPRIPAARLSFRRIGPAAALLLAAGLGLAHGFGLSTGWQILLFALPVLLASMARGDGRGQGFEALATRLGDASYSIYLTHSFVIGPLARVYARVGLHSPLLFVACALLVSAVVGLLCFKVVETPLIRRLTAGTGRLRWSTRGAA